MKRTLTFIVCLIIFVPSAGVRAQERQSSGLFVVIVNDKRGYIDRAGKIIIEPQFAGADYFSEGLAVVATDDNGYAEGYINETGEIVIRPQFDKAVAFSEGLALVGFDLSKREVKVGGQTYYTRSIHPAYKWGYIDKTGKYIVEPMYSMAFDFAEGLAAVKKPGGNFGFIDKTGRMVIPAQFAYAGSFSGGLACVWINGKYGFIDKSGGVVIKPRFTSPAGFSEGLALVRAGGKVIDPKYHSFDDPPGGKHFYIDKTGKPVIRPAGKFEGARPFSEGLAVFEVKKRDGRLYYGYIDKEGNVAIEPQFVIADDFSDGLARVYLNHKWGYIDKTGQVVIRADFSYVRDFHGGLAGVQTGGLTGDDLPNVKYGYIDKSGKVVWPPSK